MGYLKNEAKKTSFPHIFFLKANPMNNAIKTFIGSSAILSERRSYHFSYKVMLFTLIKIQA